MTDVILNGRYLNSKEFVHLYLKYHLGSRVYYGNNLDALWDVLSTYSEPLKIYLVNKDELIENLGEYGESIIKVIEDAEDENSNIVFKII